MKFLLSVESWNSFFEWGSRLLVAGTVAFGAGAILSSRVIKARQEQAIAASNQRAGEANERAAKLEKEAEEARLRTAQIQALIEWRTLSQDQITKLQNALSGKPSSIKLTYVANDPEALYFAIKVSEGFTNWNVTSGSRTYSGTLVFGLRILGPSETDVNLVQDAFRSAGIPFSTDAIKGSSIEFGAVGNPDQGEPGVEIIVGSKPRPVSSP